MSIVSVEKISDGSGGSEDTSPIKRQVDVYRVITDDIHDDGSVVLYATDPNTGLTVPDRGQGHDNNSLLRVESKDEKPLRDSPLTHDVSVRYGTRTGTLPNEDPETGEVIENPLLRPPIVTINTVRTAKAGPKAYFLKSTGPDVWTGPWPIQNSSRELIALEQEITDPQIVVTNNESHANVQSVVELQQTWTNTINDAVFLGQAIGTVRISEINGNLQRENDILFWQVTYTLDIRKATWYLIIKDEGRKRLRWDNVTNTMFREDIIDKKTSNPVTSPVALDGNGVPLDVEGSTNDADPLDIFVFRTWRQYEFATFANLPFMGGVS